MKFIARHEELEIPVEVERLGVGYRLRVGQKEIVADLVGAGRRLRALRFADGRQFLILFHRDGSEYRITLAGRRAHVRIDDPLSVRRGGSDHAISDASVVTAMMPGRIVRILVSPGDEVRRGQGLLILEAMKMENEISAPRDGTVATVDAEAGATVESGAPLVTLES